MKILSEKWANERREDVVANRKIDVTTEFNLAKQFLVKLLTNHGTPFKVYNLGCGVVRITTDTDTCPCCGKALK